MIQEKKLLVDIIQAILAVDEHLEGKRIFAEYKASKTKRRAVERELEIIGEAVSKLLRINPAVEISYARMIVDLRNKVIHAYDNVNDTIIWNVVVNHLPVLQLQIENLLNLK